MPLQSVGAKPNHIGAGGLAGGRRRGRGHAGGRQWGRPAPAEAGSRWRGRAGGHGPTVPHSSRKRRAEHCGWGWGWVPFLMPDAEGTWVWHKKKQPKKNAAGDHLWRHVPFEGGPATVAAQPSQRKWLHRGQWAANKRKCQNRKIHTKLACPALTFSFVRFDWTRSAGDRPTSRFFPP